MNQYSLLARNTMHVSCWHLGNVESEAMWRLYCPDNQGVAIQTTYQKLIDSVDEYPEIHIGAVRYLDYETEVMSQGNLFDSVMQKRQSFSHEQEVRLVKCLSVDEAAANPNGISVAWPMEESVERIYINPYAPAYFEDVVRSVVTKFAGSLDEQICWSQMRSAPIFGM